MEHTHAQVAPNIERHWLRFGNYIITRWKNRDLRTGKAPLQHRFLHRLSKPLRSKIVRHCLPSISATTPTTSISTTFNDHFSRKSAQWCKPGLYF